MCPDLLMLHLFKTNLTHMKYLLKILAVIIVITYSLRLVNSQSDVLVLSGLAIIGSSVYLLARDLDRFLSSLNSEI